MPWVKAKKNVLIFPCGSEIGLELHKALSYSAYFSLVGAGSVPDCGRLAFEDYAGGLPFIDDPAFPAALRALGETRRIDFVFPAHDSAVALFPEWAEGGLLGPIRVIGSPAETGRLARSKRATYARLARAVPVPRVYGSPAEVDRFPIFLKPDEGQGSKGTREAANREELEFHLARDPSLLILEFLPGREYTIDCFTDRSGKLRFSEGRGRDRIANGISVNTVKVKDARFARMAEAINGTVRFAGAWFFQVKERANGELALMEIAPRVAGASCYHRMMGVNLPLLSLFDAMGYDVDLFENPYTLEMDRQLRNRYRFDYPFEAVYVDLDDTLVADGKANPLMLAVLYRFRGEGKRICLLTRHAARYGEPSEALLLAHRIDTRLFDRIVEVAEGDRKSRHLPAAGAIFIDDSFAERKDAAARAGIPVFDLNQAIEAFV